MGEYVKKKKNMKFQSVEALQQVVNVVNEAAAALDGPTSSHIEFSRRQLSV